ncbi:MAG TPA: DUF5916 domain-containing protein [Thermoanaerobaculia bacterium]|nr:DUF5916 domain-containing protein [Thermoanaerobaculia bacterium]
MNAVPIFAILVLAAAPGVAATQAKPAPDGEPPIVLPKIISPIHVDGDLSDPGWREAAKVEIWYESNVGDNVPPPVQTIAYVGYDARFFYVAFDNRDPNPAKVRAPYVDRDNVFSDQDFVGLILDPKNDRRSAVEFFVNPRGIQDDGITNDATGSEDFSPDFFWDSAGSIGPKGWVVEIRIPLTSIRYPKGDPQTWGLMLYRNYPRDFRYQIFDVKLPRGGNCFVCRSREWTGITGLPRGGHLVVAPYVTASESGHPRTGEPGTEFVNEPIEGDAGLDVKWTPNADTALDVTVNPDFSQIESDVAQISVNERFALFFPEKRPFFLEGVDLLETPISTVYTRTITSPRWGARGTGKFGSTAYTLLVTEDRGGGSVIIPGPQSSDLANQDFKSVDTIGRVRHDIGRSFVGAILTDRENEGGGYNRVLGPDFQWRPSESDEVTGQFLHSSTRTPERPDLADEWDGRKLSSGAGFLSWLHTSRTWVWRTTYEDIGDDFRADNGFLPQVGYRRARNFLGRQFFPKNFFFSRIEPIFVVHLYWERDGDILNHRIFPGVQFQGKLNSSGELDVNFDRVRVGEKLLNRKQFAYSVGVSPSRLVSRISVNGFVGQEIDFDNVRVGDGASVGLFADVRPTDHLDLQFNGTRRWLDVDAEDAGRSGRLFTASVARLRAAYTFSARAFLRLIGQYVETKRDPGLYDFEVSRKSGSFQGSALFSYKLNWQSVLFVGYGDTSVINDAGDLAHNDRQFFLKVSYAFQR